MAVVSPDSFSFASANQAWNRAIGSCTSLSVIAIGVSRIGLQSVSVSRIFTSERKHTYVTYCQWDPGIESVRVSASGSWEYLVFGRPMGMVKKIAAFLFATFLIAGCQQRSEARRVGTGGVST